jgi:hypothetical protein
VISSLKCRAIFHSEDISLDICDLIVCRFAICVNGEG